MKSPKERIGIGCNNVCCVLVLYPKFWELKGLEVISDMAPVEIKRETC